jgi:hypothetical protein
MGGGSESFLANFRRQLIHALSADQTLQGEFAATAPLCYQNFAELLLNLFSSTV